MSVQDAISAALKLRDELGKTVQHAQSARAILRTMNADALASHAAERDVLNQRAAQHAERVAEAIRSLAAAHARADLTVSDIRALYPFEGEQLANVLAEVRARSSALKELDSLHHQLATRALSFVRAYVTHLAPAPQAYSRRGQPVASDATTRSEHA